MPVYRKGIWLTILTQGVEDKWQHKQSWVWLQEHRQEFSVLANKHGHPGMGLLRERVAGLEKVVILRLLRLALDAP